MKQPTYSQLLNRLATLLHFNAVYTSPSAGILFDGTAQGIKKRIFLWH